MLQNFVDAVRGDAELFAPIDQGLPSVELANDLVLSTFTRSAVDLGHGRHPLSGFFSPVKREGGLTWGAGPVLSLPTDTDPTLGSGKWGLGPTGLALVSTAKWTYGALVNHVWGIADTGDVERADLSTTFLQPFLARHLRGAVTATIQSESTYNWEADSGEEWTVPTPITEGERL